MRKRTFQLETNFSAKKFRKLKRAPNGLASFNFLCQGSLTLLKYFLRSAELLIPDFYVSDSRLMRNNSRALKLAEIILNIRRKQQRQNLPCLEGILKRDSINNQSMYSSGGGKTSETKNNSVGLKLGLTRKRSLEGLQSPKSTFRKAFARPRSPAGRFSMIFTIRYFNLTKRSQPGDYDSACKGLSDGAYQKKICRSNNF